MDGFQQRYAEGYWDAGDEYLQNCCLLQHNDDYLASLVKQVWQLKKKPALLTWSYGTVAK